MSVFEWAGGGGGRLSGLACLYFVCPCSVDKELVGSPNKSNYPVLSIETFIQL